MAATKRAKKGVGSSKLGKTAGKDALLSPPRHEKKKTLPELPPGAHYGVTYKTRETFVIPTTTDTLSAFLPENLNMFSLISFTCCMASVILTFTGRLTQTQSVCIFFFWRFSYNVGLGLLLRSQSIHNSFANGFARWTADPQSRKAKLAYWVAGCGYRPKDNLDPRDFPSDFNAWVVFKNFVTIILVNDGCNYILLGYQFLSIPEELTLTIVGQYALGIVLGLVNYSAKRDAHRCIGTYCWYYGDFFYRKEQKLTFDGIFELFPHPMYTVGYSLYYGYSLLCQSYPLLFVSLAAHMMQLSFLMLIEEPHIKRIYGDNTEPMDKKTHDLLYDPQKGMFPQKMDAVFYKDINMFRFADFSLVVCSVYTLAFCVLVEDPFWTVVQVVAWRFVHWFGLGGLLLAQSRNELFTRWYTNRGRPLYEAFNNWKGFYNFSISINLIAFIGCAYRYFDYTLVAWDVLSNYQVLASFVGGTILILLNTLILTSTYNQTGEYSWYYGDFFIRNEATVAQARLCYSGIYRFLNNPECLTGYVGLYGAAMICQSWEIFFLAALSQFLNTVFVQTVEAPHMKRVYADIRDDGGFTKGMKTGVSKADKVLPSFPQGVKKLQTKAEQAIQKRIQGVRLAAFKELHELYKKIAKQKQPERSKNTLGKVTLKFNDMHVLGESLTVSYKTTNVHDKLDWLGIYPADVDSQPGHSGGKWRFVPEEQEGDITFPAHLLPKQEGVFEVRYHIAGKYDVVASKGFIINSSFPKDLDSKQ